MTNLDLIGLWQKMDSPTLMQCHSRRPHAGLIKHLPSSHFWLSGGAHRQLRRLINRQLHPSHSRLHKISPRFASNHISLATHGVNHNGQIRCFCFALFLMNCPLNTKESLYLQAAFKWCAWLLLLEQTGPFLTVYIKKNEIWLNTLSLEETRISLLAKPSVVPKPAWLVHLMDTFQGIVCDIIKSTKLGNRSNFIKVKAWGKTSHWK